MRILALKEQLAQATGGRWAAHRAPGGQHGVTRFSSRDADEANILRTGWGKKAEPDAALVATMHEALPSLLAIAEAAEQLYAMSGYDVAKCTANGCEDQLCRIGHALKSLAEIPSTVQEER